LLCLIKRLLISYCAFDFAQGQLTHCITINTIPARVLLLLLLLLHVLLAELVKQLLDAGASATEPSGLCQLQPLHLACMPPFVNPVGQVRK
jgi:hypothetical protein